MTKRALTALLLAAATLPLAACVDGPGPGYASGPYAYDGYYDGYYGDVYDGYWGDDDAFYYRRGPHDHAYIRGDAGHFAHEAPQGGGSYHAMHGSFTPGRGMNMPHFSGGHGGGGHMGGGDHH